jgi:alpha-N-acetylglucosamine transferase
MDFSLRRIKLLYFAVLILLVLRRQTFLLSASIAQFNYENNLSFDPPNVNVYQSTLNQEVSQSKQTKAPVFRKWAYAFVVGGCDSRRPEYRGFLYNIAIAAEILQESGSKADIIALIQMSAATNEKSLPEREAKLLEAMNVKVEYIPKFNHMVHENFYSLMIEKFRILQMTKYSRVIFMDADVMPFCSLDYLFELSEPESGKAKLKENVVISYSNQPAHGGFFMLRPGKGDYDHIQKIIRETEEKSMNLSGPEYWDVVEGWGHKIMPPDRWRSSIPRFTSTNWSWHGVHADQGLLYHW